MRCKNDSYFYKRNKKQQTRVIFSSKLEMIIENCIKIYKLYNSLVTLEIAIMTKQKIPMCKFRSFFSQNYNRYFKNTRMPDTFLVISFPKAWIKQNFFSIFSIVKFFIQQVRNLKRMRIVAICPRWYTIIKFLFRTDFACCFMKKITWTKNNETFS